MGQAMDRMELLPELNLNHVRVHKFVEHVFHPGEVVLEKNHKQNLGTNDLAFNNFVTIEKPVGKYEYLVRDNRRS